MERLADEDFQAELGMRSEAFRNKFYKVTDSGTANGYSKVQING